MRREIVRLCALLLALCWLVGPALAVQEPSSLKKTPMSAARPPV